jgi:hypothetical protein
MVGVGPGIAQLFLEVGLDSDLSHRGLLPKVGFGQSRRLTTSKKDRAIVK